MAVLLAMLTLVGPAPLLAQPVVVVHDVSGLYAAVNDPANRGALVVLAPGHYPLDPSFPNAGRLELQQDMSLQGIPGDPELTIIDAAALPDTSYAAGPLTTGAVRVGKGSNSIEWLTVQNAVAGASGITTDLVAGSPARVRIAHLVVRGNQRGIDIRNIGKSSENRVLEVELADNVFTGNNRGVGQGLRLINSGASGATIDATLHGNWSHDNVAGCIASNINTAGARVRIRSSADRFEHNANGCVFIGGLSQANATSATTDNELSVQAYGSSFEHNTEALPATFPLPGGILVIGGQSLGTAASTGNAVAIELWNVPMSDNQGVDINAYGAYSAGAAAVANDNDVTIDRAGVTRFVTVSRTIGVPQPGGGNTLIVR